MSFFALLLLPTLAAPMTDPDFKPWLRVEPSEVQLAPGGTAAFRPTLNYPEGRAYLRPPVKWSVREGAGGGSVDAMGRYTAPGQAGIYHVVVERTDAPGVRATATITVR